MNQEWVFIPFAIALHCPDEAAEPSEDAEPDEDSFLEAGGAGGAATGAGTNLCSEREDEPVEELDDAGAEL